MLEKSVRLLTLLNAFCEHPQLAGKLALKGGTALNLFLFDVPRLSVDIDLNYVGAINVAFNHPVDRECAAAVVKSDHIFFVDVVESTNLQAGQIHLLCYPVVLMSDIDIPFLTRPAPGGNSGRMKCAGSRSCRRTQGMISAQA